MEKILIIYSTTGGHTLKICNRLKQLFENESIQVNLFSLDLGGDVDLDCFDKIVIGASIRYGKHNTKVYDFIQSKSSILSEKPSAFFSVNLVARKPEKNTPETNPSLRKFLSQIPWKPSQTAVFAGRLDYPKYNFWDRFMIRLIMKITQGPTDPNLSIEFTDWKQVQRFAKSVIDMKKR